MRPLGPYARGPALRQVQRQTQTLAMTPQLRQAIQMLQLSNLELNTWLEDALETNPLLARDDGVAENGVPENGVPEREEKPRAEAADPAPLDFGAEPGLEAPEGFGETAAANLWDGEGEGAQSFAPSWSGRGGGEGGEDLPDYPQTLADKPPLREHLFQQIRIALAEPAERLIAAQLVDQLDEAGYLSGDLDALAATLGIAKKDLDAVVEKLLGLEPVGVFARSLAECLAVQLRDRNRLDPAMKALLANLELLARGDKARLMRLCGVDAGDLDDMIAEIRTLDPRPAAGFDAPPASPLIPDVLMRAAPGGQGWIVELNPDTLPRLIVDRRYYDTVAKSGVNGKARDAKRFLAARLQEANWLVRALDQRARTILRVATAIVERQKGFFEHGIAQLKPLVLRDIAEAIEVHESTVSRATANKYIATPRGTFELKFFFSTAVGAANGAAHSAESIRYRIKSLIAGENDILSDDAIVSALRREGYDLARRTVAKYRDAMRIPSSVERRRMKALGQL
ncbi:MAG TPA: RNA polymerase factor sigma-54 [Alphaproteobacteria bacterium]